MKVKTIVEHKLSTGEIMRICVRCNLYLDKNGEIDLDYYTARQYLRLMETPVEERCAHETVKPDSKEELIKKVDEATRSSFLNTYKIAVILKEIIRRLP